MLLKDLIMIHLIFLHVQSCPVLGGLLNMQKTFLRSELINNGDHLTGIVNHPEEKDQINLISMYVSSSTQDIKSGPQVFFTWTA